MSRVSGTLASWPRPNNDTGGEFGSVANGTRNSVSRFCARLDRQMSASLGQRLVIARSNPCPGEEADDAPVYTTVDLGEGPIPPRVGRPPLPRHPRRRHGPSPRWPRKGSITTHWDEILRLATSIRQGTVTASLMLRKLGAYPRQNGLALALRELGRLERSLFTLHYLKDIELRRRIHAGLNKGEARNALARAVFFNRLGELRDRTYENQRLSRQRAESRRRGDRALEHGLPGTRRQGVARAWRGDPRRPASLTCRRSAGSTST